MDSVRAQYERYPYPPLPFVALPRRDQGRELSYQRGLELARDCSAVESRFQQAPATSGHGIRILVAGGGTLEPLVVAQANPNAREIVTVDISEKSLNTLQRRYRFARTRDLLSGRRVMKTALPPLTCVRDDLHHWQGGEFDYIIASNVLHHVADPAALLARLAGWLKPDGLMRIVTYPRTSRLWIRHAGEWLKLNGITVEMPRLAKRARAVINRLPQDHPVRSCFFSHGEHRTATGIVDAFLHACEHPLSPLEWQRAATEANLTLIGETQRSTSRSSFLEALLPQTAQLTAWEKLQILDNTLELTTNPVLWFVANGPTNGPTYTVHRDTSTSPVPTRSTTGNVLWAGLSPDQVALDQLIDLHLPSAIFSEMGCALRESDQLLHRAGTDIEALVLQLTQHVGPHYSTLHRNCIIHGHTIGEYDLNTLINAVFPWDDAAWDRLEQRLTARENRRPVLLYKNAPIDGQNLAEQARWLQIRYGTQRTFLPVSVKTP